VEHICTLLVG